MRGQGMGLAAAVKVQNDLHRNERNYTYIVDGWIDRQIERQIDRQIDRDIERDIERDRDRRIKRFN